MMIEQGTIFTPNKKQLLLDEIQDEITKLNATLRGKPTDSVFSKLEELHRKLHSMLKELQDMKGVVTPQKTNEVLDTISLSKKTRLESDYIFGLKRTTFYLVAAGLIVVSAFFYTKYIRK